MSKELDNRVAVVTGGGRDIGRSICLRLAEMGASVVVNYYSSSAGADKTVADIKSAGGRAIAVKADVTDASQVARLVSETRAAFGDEIHILVNNAGGLLERRPFAEMDADLWNRVMDLNLNSVFLVTRAALEYVPKGGSIINISSLAGRNGGGGGAIAYSTSKGAVLTFSRGLAKEVGPRGIRVNSVSPGLIATTFHDTFTPDEARKNVASGTPLKREGRADEVADAVAFLASDRASFVTGESLEINGGLYFI